MHQPFLSQPHNLIDPNFRSLYVLPWLNMDQYYLQEIAHLKIAAQFKEQQMRFQSQVNNVFQTFMTPIPSYNFNVKVEQLSDFQANTTEYSHTEASPNETSQEKNTFFNADYPTQISGIHNMPKTRNTVKSAVVNETNQEAHIKFHVNNMLTFFIKEFGKTTNSQDLLRERQKYAFSQPLTDLFDALKVKYSASTKCREDMVRLVLRKALTYIRDAIREKEKISAKAASVVLCKKYFETRLGEMMKEEQIDFENEEEVLGFLLPYKKNSRNKTVNTCFIKEIFASKLFYEDYLKFLADFDEVLELDNQKKITKLEEFLINCVKDNTIGKLKGFKRLPWLKTWLETTKVIAYELLNADTWKSTQKRSKNKKLRGKTEEAKETNEL